MAPFLNKVYVISKFKNDKSWFVTIIFIVFRLNFRAKMTLKTTLQKQDFLANFKC